LRRLLAWLLGRTEDRVSRACLARLQADDVDHLPEPMGSRTWRVERYDPAQGRAYTREVPR
jgi:hypothetical protein